MNEADVMYFLLGTRIFERIAVTVAGLLFIWLGYNLFVKGVSGEASLKASKGDGEVQLLNAAPGIFFAFFGMLLIGFVSFNQIEFPATLDTGRLNQEGIMFSDSSAGSNQPVNLPDRIGENATREQHLTIIFDLIKAKMEAVDFQERLTLLDVYRTAYSLFDVQVENIAPEQLPLQ